MTARRSKYGAVRTTVNGVTFASKKEARRYSELLLLGRAGEIWDLELQPRFPLVAAATTGTLLGALQATAGTFKGRIGNYFADFAYHDRTGRVVEDVKSPATRTALYRWKVKHLKIQYGIEVREI